MIMTEEKEVQETNEPVEEAKPTLITEAREAAAEIKEATAAMKAENDRREALAADEALGGSAEAGAEPEEPKEISPKEYVDSIMNGNA